MKRLVAGLFALVACTEAGPAQVDLAGLRKDDDPTQWLALGRTWRGDRYSPLTRIDTTNVTQLGLAWKYDFRSRRGRVEFGQEATPIAASHGVTDRFRVGNLASRGARSTSSRGLPPERG